MRQPLIKQLEREDLQKVYTRAAEYPHLSTKLIKDLFDNNYFNDLSYGHVRDLEMILGKKIATIFPTVMSVTLK
jgi:hypothetical protein